MHTLLLSGLPGQVSVPGPVTDASCAHVKHSTKGWEQGWGNSRLWPGAAPRPLQFNWGGKAELVEGSEVCVRNAGWRSRP